jgi:hypothetical protein
MERISVPYCLAGSWVCRTQGYRVMLIKCAKFMTRAVTVVAAAAGLFLGGKHILFLCIFL